MRSTCPFDVVGVGWLVGWLLAACSQAGIDYTRLARGLAWGRAGQVKVSTCCLAFRLGLFFVVKFARCKLSRKFAKLTVLFANCKGKKCQRVWLGALATASS